MPTPILQTHDEAQPSLWFDRMHDPAARARLGTVLRKHQRHFAAGNHIKDDGEASHSLYILLSGWAALAKSLPEGQTQIIDFIIPGDFCSLVSADGETAVIGMEAITNTTVAIVPLKEWAMLEKSTPEILVIRERAAAAINSRIAERMLRLGRGSAEERLAYAFLELAVRSKAIQGDLVDSFHMPLTQQQLGDFMGLTSIHICRTLRRMKRDGIVSKSDHIDLSILDLAALEDLAGMSAKTLAREIMPSPRF